jgi:hypothetical protein
MILGAKMEMKSDEKDGRWNLQNTDHESAFFYWEETWVRFEGNETQLFPALIFHSLSLTRSSQAAINGSHPPFCLRSPPPPQR